MVAWDAGRPVPVNKQGLDAGLDVAHFCGRYVSEYSKKTDINQKQSSHLEKVCLLSRGALIFRIYCENGRT